MEKKTEKTGLTDMRIVKVPAGVKNMKQYEKQVARIAKLKEQAAAAEAKAIVMQQKAIEREIKRELADKAKAAKRVDVLVNLEKRFAVQQEKLAKIAALIEAEKARIAKLSGAEQ